MKIHRIENICGGWFADFDKTADGHLEITVYPRHNSPMETKLTLYNVTNEDLLELADSIQNKFNKT